MERICYNCMKKRGEGNFCSSCGKKEKNVPAHHLQPGTILEEKYELGYAIGEGGFGITYVGLDKSLQIKVAIKEFFPKSIVGRNASVTSLVSCIDEKTSNELFVTEKTKVINEARILAKFSKERGIVNVREYFEANNTAYIVMEYLEGETLEEYLSRLGILTPDNVYSLMYPVMMVVEKIHNEKVVHRDISPDNLMFDGNELKLLDFGAAREVLYSTNKSFSVILKHGYAPEEQYRRKGNQGAWTDVYSIAATMYFCITNVIPDTSLDRMHEDELKKPSDLGVKITANQENALMRALSVLPEDRFQNVNDFISAWNGKEIPLPSGQNETVMTFPPADAHKTSEQKNTSANNESGTVFGGASDFTDVYSAKRSVYNNSATEEGKSKKQKWIIPTAVGGIVALIVVIIVGISISKSVNNSQLNGENLTNEKNNPNNPVNQVMDNIENGYLDDAKDIYEEEIKSDSDKSEDLSKELQEYLETNKEKYYEEEINYEQMNDVISTVSSFGIRNLQDDIYNAKQYVNLINSSRTSFHTAEAFMDKEDYENAILNYAEVDKEDSYYDEAQNKKQECIDLYRTKALKDAEQLVAEGDYTNAIAALKKSMEILPNDSQIQTQITLYTEEQRTFEINTAVESAKSYKANNDYVNALNELKKVSSYNDDAVNELYDTYYSEFLTYALTESENVFKTSGHQAALTKLNEYETYFGSETSFVEKQDYYAGLAPVSLSEMKEFESWGWEAESVMNAEDHLGNVFDAALEIKTSQHYNYYVEYYVNKNFKSISGILALSDSSYTNVEVNFMIYADDELIYSSNFGAKTDPINFKVDITGKKYIKIKVNSLNYWGYLLLADAKLNKY